MVEIRSVNTEDKKQVNEFVQFHYDLYKGDPNWVPPFRNDIKIMLNKKKHPFYEHSDAEFYTAWKDGKMAGRIAVINNKPYNEYHHEHSACVFLYDAIDDDEVSKALFDAAADWARKQGLDHLLGPKGFSLFDGYGVLAEGFNERQTMNMSAYNYPYYIKQYEAYGFYPVNNFVSMKFDVSKYEMPEKVKKVAEIVQKRNTLQVKSFKSKKELLDGAMDIAHMYFNSFKNNWEYYPLTDNEFKFFIDNVITFADPKMIKFITDPAKNDEVVGMLLCFPDISAAMQRHNGNMTPALIIDMLLEMKKTPASLLNGFGILEEYHHKGGNALLYCSMEDLLRENANFVTCEAVQMADSAKEVRREMQTLGLEISKVHRVYECKI